MYWNRSAADVAAAWQAEIESKLETGASALLLAGAPDAITSSTVTLLGLQYVARHRIDVATPLLVAGGNSAVWLGLLMAPRPTGSDLYAPAPTVIYGGGDEATYLAIVGLTAAQVAPPLATHAAIRATTPFEMGIHLAPRLQPGAATPWEMLPLVEVGEQLASAQGDSASGDPTGDWIAWGIMLFAFCLVLSALLI